MIRPGPGNLITDVGGILVGHAEDHRLRSGTTVVLAEVMAVCAADVRGGAPATRGADAFQPGMLIDRADAIVLSGGSSWGLAAADGVMAGLAATGRGVAFGGALVPIVGAGILFDLTNGGDKAWGEANPYPALGRAAFEAARPRFALGNAGAGLGARAGGLKGGLGSASFVYGDAHGPITVGAIAAANPVGSVVVPGTATFWAAPLERDGELGGQLPLAGPLAAADLDHLFPPERQTATALAVVATDAALTIAEASRVAWMAQDGFARAIRPIHTPFDGDSVFVLATGQRGPLEGPAGLARLGMLAADCVARAVARGVYEAEDLGPLRSYRSVHGRG
ncbi:MAG TPA: P1 family peptidase [Geminicoccaceae bacterium]